MVCKAAVKIRLIDPYSSCLNNKEIIIPCHRHSDAFQILSSFMMRKDIDYTELAQGFLDENDNFLTRTEAWQEAKKCHQFLDSYIEEHYDDVMQPTVLYSEDIY